MNQKEYNKNYYAKHGDKIKERMYEKIECEHCQHQVSRCNMPKHQRTKKCISVQENDKVGKLVNEFYHLKKSKTAANKEVVEKRLNELYDELHVM